MFQLIVEVTSELWGARLNAGNWAAVSRRIARKTDFIARALRLN
jgi:ribulose-5-phosphate 4-epimerase/fuculose-1-phosphate aldolase